MFLQIQEFVWAFLEAVNLLDWLPSEDLRVEAAGSRGMIEPTG